MIDGSVLQSAQKCFEKKSRVVVKMVVMIRVVLKGSPIFHCYHLYTLTERDHDKKRAYVKKQFDQKWNKGLQSEVLKYLTLAFTSFRHHPYT